MLMMNLDIFKEDFEKNDYTLNIHTGCDNPEDIKTIKKFIEDLIDSDILPDSTINPVYLINIYSNLAYMEKIEKEYTVYG